MTNRSKPLAWLRRLARFVKGKSTPPGTLSGRTFAADVWGAAGAPGAHSLIASYRGTAYACANLCAQGVASVPLRLYVETRRGQEPPRVRTAPVTAARLKALRDRPAFARRVTGASTVEEVLEHPLLDLLQNVNAELDGFTLIELTQLYMETVGSAYWYLPRNALGVIEAIWVLEAQHVRARRGANGALTGWDYGTGPDGRRFGAHEVLPFRMPSLSSPYGEGLSPLRAAWEAVSLQERERAHANAFLENSARPDVIVSARGEYGGLGEDEAERLEERFRRKFRRGRSGGVLVISDEVDVKPLTFAPRDVQNALFHQMTREDIANAFGVPVSLLQTRDVNRANAEAGHYQLAKNAILPRCRRLEERLSQRLCPLFDERLFVAFDSPVPQDREYELKAREAHLAAGVITVNEARSEIGLAPLEEETTNG